MQAKRLAGSAEAQRLMALRAGSAKAQRLTALRAVAALALIGSAGNGRRLWPCVLKHNAMLWLFGCVAALAVCAQAQHYAMAIRLNGGFGRVC